MNKTVKILTIFFILLFSKGPVIFAVEQDSISSRAFQLFDAGEFKKASEMFKILKQNNPNLAMLNYYLGVCETENRNYSKEILNLLLSANKDQSPVNIYYYLGIQYQAAGNWEQALKQYNRFRQNNIQESDSLGVSEKIQQCFQKENPYESEYIFTENEIIEQNKFDDATEIKPDSTGITPETEAVISDTIAANNFEKNERNLLVSDSLQTNENVTNEIELPSEVQTVEEVREKTELETEGKKQTQKKANEKRIDLVITSNIRYFYPSEFQTTEGKQFYFKADSIQNKLDLILSNINQLRKQYTQEESGDKKQMITEEILTLENQTFSLKQEINTLLFQAASTENEFWMGKTQEEIQAFLSEQRSKNQVQESPNNMELTEEKESGEIIIPEFLLGEKAAITETAQNQEKDVLVYKIQIGSFSRGLPKYIEALYKKLSYIRKIENYTDENGIVVYTTGNLSKLDDAVQMQTQVRREGVEDAFVVPYFNGKRITLNQAKQIEEEL